MAAVHREREVMVEFLELYINLPTLWDIGSDLYKDRNQKSQAWELLVEKLREIEPEADVALAKTKIDHMRTAYKREEKKIKESKKTGSGANDVHVPNLWYFDLLSPVFNKDEEYRPGVETLPNDQEDSSQNERNTEGNKKYKSRGIELTKRKLIETAQELLQNNDKKSNSFGVYVGEQLDQLDNFQRQVAEKLISEVIFLARTGNLHYNTKIETPSGAPHLFTPSNNFIHSPSPSPQYTVSSPSPSPSPQYTIPPQSPQYTVPPPPSQDIRSSTNRLVNVSKNLIHSPSPSPQYTVSSPSPQYTIPPQSPQYTVPPPPSQDIRSSTNRLVNVSKNLIHSPSPSPQYTVSSPSPQYTIPPQSPQYTVPPPPSQDIRSSTNRLVNVSKNLIHSPSPSPHYIVPSPPIYIRQSSVSTSSKNIQLSSSHQFSQLSSSPQYILPNSPQYRNIASPPQSMTFISPSHPSPQISTTEQDENVIENSIPDDSSIQNYITTTSVTPSTSMQYVVSSHLIQSSSSSPIQSSSSQTILNDITYEENKQYTSHSVPSEENQTIVNKGPASSILREFLIVKRKK